MCLRESSFTALQQGDINDLLRVSVPVQINRVIIKMACTFDFNCIDPDADEELYACDEIPSAIVSPCSDNVDQNWIVEDAAQAQALAETTMYFGGSYHVEWRGNVSMDETIYAVDDTVLHTHGTHAGAVMSGNL